MSILKTLIAILGMFFGSSIIAEAIYQIRRDSSLSLSGDYATGALIGNALLITTGLMLVLISATYLWRKYSVGNNSNKHNKP